MGMTLVEELLEAAHDTEALALEWGGRMRPMLKARAARLRARAERVRGLQPERGKGAPDWHLMYALLTGDLPGSPGPATERPR
jgi:hypothetical protein